MKISQVMSSEVWGEISPKALQKGLGGRETAMVRLAENWAKLGHEVTNFVPINKAERYYEGDGFHEYVPLQLAKPMLACFPYDASVAWEMAVAFDDERIRELQPVRLVHMQVAHFLDGQMDAAESSATGVVALSEWAAGFLQHSGLDPEVPMYVRPNGVNIASFDRKKVEAKAKRGHGGVPSFVYSSSPDRGLIHLLKLWPSIREFHPEAELYVGYGVERWTDPVMWSHAKPGEMALEIKMLMDQEGVINMGSIGQKALHELQTLSNFWLYPCDPIQATETGCITAVENLAAGNPSIITDADCLESEFGSVATVVELPVDGQFINAFNDLYENHDLYTDRVLAGRDFAEDRDWEKIAPTWIDLFEQNKSV